MKTPEQFQKQVADKQIKFWPIHKCSICGYQCGFIFQAEGVYYDNGCSCVYYPPSQREWADVAEQYNMQTNPEVIAEMDRFWGFETHIINNKERDTSMSQDDEKQPGEAGAGSDSEKTE